MKILKKIFLLVFIFNIFVAGSFIANSNCTIDDINEVNISNVLTNCKPDKVVGGGNMKVDGGLAEKVNNFTKNIALVIGILAVGALVYAGMLMQFSMGEDEKIKKAKDIFKWTVIGFIALISVYGVIYIVINFMFSLGG